MKYILIKIILFSIIAIIIVSCFLLILNNGMYEPKNSEFQEEIFFTIEKGQGVKEISDNLEKAGLIKNKWFFRIYVVLTDIDAQLKAGEYSLSQSMSVSKIAEKFYLGDVSTLRIVILEGWNLRNIAEMFERKEMFKSEDLFELTGYPATNKIEPSGLPFSDEFIDNFDFLTDKPINVNLEGYLFPDTYQIRKKEDSLRDIVWKMLNNFGSQLTQELRDEIKSQEKTIFEIITVASLIEKEVASYKDKTIVSGIIWKRLEIDMPLQIDATVNYITEKNMRAVLVDDTKIDSLYNTYKYKGLPLGPISNPGIESIKAAIYPEKTSYLYYLSAKNGQTIFSSTFEQHKANKAIYLQ
ncbi:MAG: endolytic transglycosylase MltG [Candidatus Nealsonbacteria bacterium]